MKLQNDVVVAETLILTLTKKTLLNLLRQLVTTRNKRESTRRSRIFDFGPWDQVVSPKVRPSCRRRAVFSGSKLWWHKGDQACSALQAKFV